MLMILDTYINLFLFKLTYDGMSYLPMSEFISNWLDFG